MPDEAPDVRREPAAATSPPGPEVEDSGEALDFRFTLYICGATERSQRAVVNARRLCDEHLPGRYTLEVIDLYRQPELAQSRDIFAIPTLVRELPRPLRRFIGDLSENERLVVQMTPAKWLDR